MQNFESGYLDYLDDYIDWYAAKKGLNHWNKKLALRSLVWVDMIKISFERYFLKMKS